MGVFNNIEQAVINAVNAHFTVTTEDGPENVLANVEGISGDLNAEALDKSRKMMPGVFVRLYDIGQVNDHGDAETKWLLFPIAGSAGGENARRKGTKTSIGIYELVEKLLQLNSKPLVWNGNVIGTISIGKAQALYASKLKDKGAEVWSLEMSLTIQLPNQDLSLDPFITFAADYQMSNGEEIQETIELEQ